MFARLTTATATFAALTALAGSASAIDADRRLGDDDRPDLPELGLLAPIRPDLRCHVVNVIPLGWTDSEERTLLYRPCDPPVVLQPYEPFEDRPPILIPVVPGR
jgi:hypothetical protein